MTRSEIIALQERVGTVPDGFWGPKSIAATQSHLRRMMPTPNPWPVATPATLARFYGDPGKNQVAARLRPIDVTGLGVRYAGKPVRSISCHEMAGASLLRILKAISKSRFAHILHEYAGVYNHRPMRGGTRWSLHAYGAAIDLAPATNGLHTHWPTRATMPIEVMEFFAKEGWLPAGAFWNKDAMHMQATQ